MLSAHWARWLPPRDVDCGGHLSAGPLLLPPRGAILFSSGSALTLPCCLTLVTRCCVGARPLSPSRSFLYYFFFYWGEGDGFFFSRYHICASPPPCSSQWVPFSYFTSAVLQRTCLLEGSFDKHLDP